ncbi:MAG: tetratricopeptide repeat protein [Hyphomonadaceae bacterium]|nr:tetratricopeptide repeat protein [Clostridia bacterium]
MKEKKKFLWLYGTILFTVAFVLIFMAAMVQLRMNKDFLKYAFGPRNGSVVDGTRRDAASVSEENRVLREQIYMLESEKKTVSTQLQEVKNARDLLEKSNTSNLNILTAKQFVDQKKLKEAALLLMQIDVAALSEGGKSLYDSFAAVTIKRAADASTLSGQKLYKAGRFQEASIEFKTVYQILKPVATADLALYYLALSTKKMGDVAQAKVYFQEFLDNYPSSKYAKDVTNQIKE